MPEFENVYQNIKHLPAKERQDWIWDKIIYANPIKAIETLRELNQYKPLVTFDNSEEIKKIKKYAPQAGLALRLKVPNTGAMVELSSKFGASPGEAVDLILEADKVGLTVEGISFHVGSQTTNFGNYVAAINLAANIFKEARDRGYTKMNLLDIGGGFPAPYDASVKPFRELATVINRELDRLFPKTIRRCQKIRDSRRAGPVPVRHRRAPLFPKSSARPCATANSATTSTTACITPFPASSSTIAITTSRRSSRGADANLLGVRPDVRRAGRGFDGGKSAEQPGTRRPALQRTNRRLQPRLLDLFQRLPARDRGACEPVNLHSPPRPPPRKIKTHHRKKAQRF